MEPNKGLSDEAIQKVLDKSKELMSRFRVTKVVCSRTVKGRQGDTFVGFSVATDSVQEDGLKGLGTTDTSVESEGMTLHEARIASHLLSLQADIAAHEHARAGALINEADFQKASKALKNNYAILLASALEND